MTIRFAVVNALLTIPLFSSCISRTAKLPKDQVILQAETISKSALIERLRSNSLAIKTLMVSKSTLKASRMLSNESIKNYHDVNGRIAVDRPGRLKLEITKLITLAEMVSDDKQYRVSIPPEGKFGVGNIATPVQGAEFPYNLRPSHILDALFVDGEQFVGKSGIDSYVRVDKVSQPDGVHSYSVILFGKVGGTPLEELWFDRTAGVQEVVRKKSYLPDGEIEADIRYSDYKMFGNIPFPMTIEIQRPIENYSLEMKIESLELNTPIDTSMFVLKRPDGVDDVDLNTGKDIKPK